MTTNNSTTNTIKTAIVLDDAALAVVRSTMNTITGIVIKNNYSTTKVQKNMLVGWCKSLDLLADMVITEDIEKNGNYQLAVEACLVWLENQGIKTAQVEPTATPKTVGTIISKPVKKAPESVGFDHVRFYEIIAKMTETKRLYGNKNVRSAKVVSLNLAYQLPSGNTEHVEIRRTKLDGDAKDPGSIYVHINDKWCLNIGTENTSHKIIKRSDFDFTAYLWLDSFLSDFTANPAKIAAKSGLLTKKCCVCSITLEKGTSLSVGYGKQCAANMGWPYGGKVKEIVSGEVALTQAVQAIQAEKCEIVTEVKSVKYTRADVEAILPIYEQQKKFGLPTSERKINAYTKVSVIARSIVPELLEHQTAHYYADALYEWLKTQDQPQPEVTEPIIDSTESDAIQGVKAILKAYHANPRDGYQGLRHVALSILPNLKKQAKAQVYLDALYEWLDSQPSVAEVPVETVTEVAPVPVVEPTPVQVEVPVTPVTEQPQPEEIRLTEQNNSVVTTSVETLAEVPVTPVTEQPVEASQPTVKLSEQSQAVLDSVKPHVTPERYAELYLEMLRLESQAVKPKKTRKPSGTGTPKTKKDPSVMVNEIARLCQIADEQGMDQAFIESGKTDSKYMPRAYRSYRHIYQQSEVIRDLVDSGKLAWGSVHHYLAGRNPLKCGIPHLEDFAVALSQGLWIENPTPLNPRPKAYNKNTGELPPN